MRFVLFVIIVTAIAISIDASTLTDKSISGIINYYKMRHIVNKINKAGLDSIGILLDNSTLLTYKRGKVYIVDRTYRDYAEADDMIYTAGLGCVPMSTAAVNAICKKFEKYISDSLQEKRQKIKDFSAFISSKVIPENNKK